MTIEMALTEVASPCATCPRTLPPHWKHRSKAMHSSAEAPSLMIASMSKNHARYLMSSAPRFESRNTAVPA